MRRSLIIAVLLLAAGALLAPARPAVAKGNDNWILTGGDLGSYAMPVTLGLMDMPGAAVVPTPTALPTPRYDLYNSYNDLAVPYQMWVEGGAWVHYYPSTGLLEFQGDDTRGVPHTWYRPPPDIAAALRQAVDTALAEKAAGRLEPSPAAADFRNRSLDRVDYRISPYEAAATGTLSAVARAFYASDHGSLQVTGAASEDFILRGLAKTVSQPPAGPSPDLPVYEITYAGKIWPGGGIGGLLGYYSPPADGQPGRFWDNAFQYGNTRYYATTRAFDAAIARALGPATRGTSLAPHVGPPSGGLDTTTIFAASLVGFALAAVLVALKLVPARLHRRRIG